MVNCGIRVRSDVRVCVRVRPRGFYKTGLSFVGIVCPSTCPAWGAPCAPADALQFSLGHAFFVAWRLSEMLPFRFCVSRGVLGRFSFGGVVDRVKGKAGFLGAIPLKVWRF